MATFRLITGYLGSGRRTLSRYLGFHYKPANLAWVILAHPNTIHRWHHPKTLAPEFSIDSLVEAEVGRQSYQQKRQHYLKQLKKNPYYWAEQIIQRHRYFEEIGWSFHYVNLVDWSAPDEYLYLTNLTKVVTIRVFRKDSKLADEYLLENFPTDFLAVPKDDWLSHWEGLSKTSPIFRIYNYLTTY